MRMKVNAKMEEESDWLMGCYYENKKRVFVEKRDGC